jgi:hypothetical protein
MWKKDWLGGKVGPLYIGSKSIAVKAALTLLQHLSNATQAAGHVFQFLEHLQELGGAGGAQVVEVGLLVGLKLRRFQLLE